MASVLPCASRGNKSQAINCLIFSFNTKKSLFPITPILYFARFASKRRTWETIQKDYKINSNI